MSADGGYAGTLRKSETLKTPRVRPSLHKIDRLLSSPRKVTHDLAVFRDRPAMEGFYSEAVSRRESQGNRQKPASDAQASRQEATPE